MHQVSEYLEFKDDDPEEEKLLKGQWESGNLHPGIVVVILYAARLHYLITGKKAVITSLYREKTTDSGVHEDWRAGDLRTWYLDDIQKTMWEADINTAFPYEYSGSKTAKTAWIHEVRGEDGKSKGEHLHLQTGPFERKPLNFPQNTHPVT